MEEDQAKRYTLAIFATTAEGMVETNDPPPPTLFVFAKNDHDHDNVVDVLLVDSEEDLRKQIREVPRWTTGLALMRDAYAYVAGKLPDGLDEVEDLKGDLEARYLRGEKNVSEAVVCLTVLKGTPPAIGALPYLRPKDGEQWKFRYPVFSDVHHVDEETMGYVALLTDGVHK